MIKIFYKLSVWLRRRSAPGDWRRDPLLHPDLRGMTERQIADLPFDRHR